MKKIKSIILALLISISIFSISSCSNNFGDDSEIKIEQPENFAEDSSFEQSRCIMRNGGRFNNRDSFNN